MESRPALAEQTGVDKIVGIRNRGMQGGWWSEHPHKPFGPLYIATKDENIKKADIRRKNMEIDPDVEITPDYDALSEGSPKRILFDGSRREFARAIGG